MNTNAGISIVKINTTWSRSSELPLKWRIWGGPIVGTQHPMSCWHKRAPICSMLYCALLPLAWQMAKSVCFAFDNIFFFLIQFELHHCRCQCCLSHFHWASDYFGSCITNVSDAWWFVHTHFGNSFEESHKMSTKDSQSVWRQCRRQSEKTKKAIRCLFQMRMFSRFEKNFDFVFFWFNFFCFRFCSIF